MINTIFTNFIEMLYSVTEFVKIHKNEDNFSLRNADDPSNRLIGFSASCNNIEDSYWHVSLSTTHKEILRLWCSHQLRQNWIKYIVEDNFPESIKNLLLVCEIHES